MVVFLLAKRLGLDTRMLIKIAEAHGHAQLIDKIEFINGLLHELNRSVLGV